MKPLQGVRIIALEQFVAGPIATMWLADAGADVIKVEAPGGGDTARTVAPQRQDEDGRSQSLSFLRMNRGKRSVALDVKTDEGRALLVELLRTSDVFFTNLGPDSLVRLRLDYESLKREVGEGLVYASVSGFGHEDVLPGPLSGQPAFDIVAQAMAGLMGRADGAQHGPVYSGFPLADIFAGVTAAMGTLLAIIGKERGGIGTHVDVAMYDGALALNELALILYGATGSVPMAGAHGMASPFGVFEARDAHLTIGVIDEGLWKKLCLAIGRTDLLERPDLASGYARLQAPQEMASIMDEWLRDRTAAEAVAALTAMGVPAGLVQDEHAVLQCAQARARRMFVTVEDAAWGPVQVVGNPIKSTWTGRDTSPPPAPRLGEHTDSVLADLGLDEAATAILRARGVVL